jgi:hypothetical protein
MLSVPDFKEFYRLGKGVATYGATVAKRERKSVEVVWRLGRERSVGLRSRKIGFRWTLSLVAFHDGG